MRADVKGPIHRIPEPQPTPEQPEAQSSLNPMPPGLASHLSAPESRPLESRSPALIAPSLPTRGELPIFRDISPSVRSVFCNAAGLNPQAPITQESLSSVYILEFNRLENATLAALIPLLANCPNLTRLKLSGFFTVLPETIGDLSALRELDLSSCLQLRVLPETLGNLSKLQILALFNCKALQELPQGVIRLSQLRELNIRGSGLIEIASPNYLRAKALLASLKENNQNLEIEGLSTHPEALTLPEPPLPLEGHLQEVHHANAVREIIPAGNLDQPTARNILSLDWAHMPIEQLKPTLQDLEGALVAFCGMDITMDLVELLGIRGGVPEKAFVFFRETMQKLDQRLATLPEAVQERWAGLRSYFLGAPIEETLAHNQYELHKQRVQQWLEQARLRNPQGPLVFTISDGRHVITLGLAVRNGEMGLMVYNRFQSEGLMPLRTSSVTSGAPILFKINDPEKTNLLIKNFINTMQRSYQGDSSAGRFAGTHEAIFQLIQEAEGTSPAIETVTQLALPFQKRGNCWVISIKAILFWLFFSSDPHASGGFSDILALRQQARESHLWCRIFYSQSRHDILEKAQQVHGILRARADRPPQLLSELEAVIKKATDHVARFDRSTDIALAEAEALHEKNLEEADRLHAVRKDA